MTDREEIRKNGKDEIAGEPGSEGDVISGFVHEESGRTIEKDREALETLLKKYRDMESRVDKLEHDNRELSEANRALQEQLHESKESCGPGREEMKKALKKLQQETLLRKGIEKLFDIYKYALKNHPEAFTLTDSEGKIEYVNPSYEEITGWKKAEVKGKYPEVLKESAHKPDDYAELWKKIRKGDIWTGVIQRKCKDGSHRDEYTIVIPIMKREARVSSFVIFSRKHHVKSEKKAVLPGTDSAELINEQDFISKIARHFNNINTAIKGNTDLAVMKANDDNPLLSYIQEIDLSADKAMEITRKLLAYCGKQVLFPAAVDLEEFFDDKRDEIDQITGENVKVKIKQKPALPPILVDPLQLEQVLVSIIDNSINAMPYGGDLIISTDLVELSEDYCRHIGCDEPGEFVNIRVQDTGIGMNQEAIKRAFEPFYQAGEGKDTIGLGLSAVYGILKQSGAYIKILSTLGRGTTVSIYFKPVLEKEESKPKEQDRKAPAKTVRTHKRVLVIDDEDIVREIVREHLTAAGYEVFIACDAKEALERLKDLDYQIDLLLTDVIMPGVDGFKLTEELKRTVPELKIILMSGYIKQSISNEADGIINKPFKRKALLEKVEEVING